MLDAMSKASLWTLLRKGGEAFAGAVIPQSSRAETVSWFEGVGHVEGHLTDWQQAGGLMVRLRVGVASRDGPMLFHAELFNHASNAWRGGINLTDRIVADSEAILTIRPAGTAVWWSYLAANTCQVFVRVDPGARTHL